MAKGSLQNPMQGDCGRIALWRIPLWAGAEGAKYSVVV